MQFLRIKNWNLFFFPSANYFHRHWIISSYNGFNYRSESHFSSFYSVSKVNENLSKLNNIDECLDYFTQNRTLFKPSDYVAIVNKLNFFLSQYKQNSIEEPNYKHFDKEKNGNTSLNSVQPFASSTFDEIKNSNIQKPILENNYLNKSQDNNSTSFYFNSNNTFPKKLNNLNSQNTFPKSPVPNIDENLSISSSLDNRYQLYQKKAFINILKDAIYKMDRFKAEELIDFCQTISYINPNEKLALQAALSPLISSLYEISTQKLAQAASLYSHSKQTNKIFCETVFNVSIKKKENFDSSSLASLCESASKFSYKPVQFLRGLLDIILNKIDDFNAHQLSLILYAYTKQRKSCNDAQIIIIFEKLFSILNTEKLNYSDLLRISWICTTLKLPNSQNCLIKIEEQIFKYIPILNSRGIATLIWAFSSMNVGSYDLYINLKLNFIKLYRQMNYKGLANSLYGLSLQLNKIMNEDGLFDTQFLDITEEYLINIMPNLNEQDIATIASAYTLGRCGSHTFFSSLQIICLQNSKYFTSNQITKILYAFGVVREGRKIFSLFHIYVLEMLNLFELHEICDIAWSYAVAKTKEIIFWEALFSSIDVSRLHNNQRCALLFPAINEAMHLVPELKSSDMEKLKFYTANAFWDFQLLDFPSNFAKEIETGLKLLNKSFNIEICFNFDGYLVDLILLKEPFEKSIVFVCLTSLNFHKKLNRPLGQSMIKYRFLNRCGISQIGIVWDDWQKLPNIQSKCDFLHHLLSQKKFDN